jgi:hypothetical protein
MAVKKSGSFFAQEGTGERSKCSNKAANQRGSYNQ